MEVMFIFENNDCWLIISRDSYSTNKNEPTPNNIQSQWLHQVKQTILMIQLYCLCLSFPLSRSHSLHSHMFVLQLNIAKNSESILDGFLEGPLKFPPTYKFDVGTHTYDTRYVILCREIHGL